MRACNVKEYKFEGVTRFTYVGVEIEKKGHEEQEIQARIETENRKYRMLMTLMKSKCV